VAAKPSAGKKFAFEFVANFFPLRNLHNEFEMFGDRAQNWAQVFGSNRNDTAK